MADELPCELYLRIREYSWDLDKETLRYVCKRWYGWSGPPLYKGRLDIYVQGCVTAKYKRLLMYFVPDLQLHTINIWKYGNAEMRTWMIECILYNVRLKDGKAALGDLIVYGMNKPDLSLLNYLLRDKKLVCRELIQEKYNIHEAGINATVRNWLTDNGFDAYTYYYK